MEQESELGGRVHYFMGQVLDGGDAVQVNLPFREGATDRAGRAGTDKEE